MNRPQASQRGLGTTAMTVMSLEEEEKAIKGAQIPDDSPYTLSDNDSTTSTTSPPSNTVGEYPPSPPPDGGLRAWSQVFACLLANAMTWGTTYSFGVSQLHYTTTLSLPSSQVSWIGSVQVFLVFGMCAFSGRLTDAGYARETAAVGCALATFGYFMTSLAKDYWQILLAQGVCTGIGLGLIFMPAITVAGSYFQKKRAFALAVSACGSSVGGLAFPSTIQYLTPKMGFPWAMRCAGFLMLTFSVMVCLLLRPRTQARKAGSMIDWPAFTEMRYCLFALGAFLNFYGVYFAMFYINSYARNVVGFTTVEAVSLLLITNAVGIPTRPIVGFIADTYLGPLNTFAILQAAFAAVLFGWIGVRTRADMYIFCVFLGIESAASQSMYLGALASLTKDPQKMGTRFGMVATICAFGTLAGPPTGGAIIDQTGGEYLGALLWGGAVMLCSAMAVLAARIATTGRKWKAKV